MLIKSPLSAAAVLSAMLLALPTAPATAQDSGYQRVAVDNDASFSTQELDQILAPIALYPDELLSNVLMASTYPLEVVEAARWLDEPGNGDLTGDALTRALENQDWDPSVKSLTQFPDVLEQMSENLDWMRTLGDAVLADQAAVMDRIQFLRAKADDAGHLDSNERRRVTSRYEDDREYIYIEPQEPDVVYVPVYEPAVYGTWWYPDYPPYYWDYDVSYVGFYYWGVGVAVAPTLWRWSYPRWRRHYFYVDANRYNRISRHKMKRGVDRWHHNARHRRGVRYRNATLRRRHQRDSIKGARTNRFVGQTFGKKRVQNGNKPKRFKLKGRDPRKAKFNSDDDRRRRVGRRTVKDDKAKPGKRSINKSKQSGAKKGPPSKKKFSQGSKKPGSAKKATKKQIKKSGGPSGAKQKKSGGKPKAGKGKKSKKDDAGPGKRKKKKSVGSKKRKQSFSGKRKGGSKARKGGGRKKSAAKKSSKRKHAKGAGKRKGKGAKSRGKGGKGKGKGGKGKKKKKKKN